MADPSYTDLSPIAAAASGAGEAALAVIRTSGAGALELLARVFSRPKTLLGAAGNSVVYGWIVKDGVRIDETLVSVYRAPESYTGEDGADIVCHGGKAAPRAVLAALFDAGFRPALRGEFTFRAFANGKLDLPKAESVLEAVNARTDKARENAVSRLSGILSQEIEEIRRLLLKALSAAELALDYSELDGVEDAPSGLPERAAVEESLARLEALTATYRAQRLYSGGALLVICGKPNAGKSSVFNLLLKEERAIVTPIPGTTRDYIEAEIDLGGVPLRIVDTAGLRESVDIIEAEGVRRSRALVGEADIVLAVVDGTEDGAAADLQELLQELPSDLCRESRCIPVWNKIDDMRCKDAPRGITLPPVQLSAKTGEGLSLLLKAIETVIGAGVTEGPSLGSDRQKALVDRAISAIKEALGLDKNDLDLAAPALKDAVDALGEISGIPGITADNILADMFSRFCVGK